jgi:hypothetical protein
MKNRLSVNTIRQEATSQFKLYSLPTSGDEFEARAQSQAKLSTWVSNHTLPGSITPLLDGYTLPGLKMPKREDTNKPNKLMSC